MVVTPLLHRRCVSGLAVNVEYIINKTNNHVKRWFSIAVTDKNDYC